MRLSDIVAVSYGVYNEKIEVSQLMCKFIILTMTYGGILFNSQARVADESA